MPHAQGPPAGYPGAAQQRIPMPQVQQFFLEGMRPEMGHMGNLARTMAQPPQMQKTFTIRNDVNLKKNTLKLIRDEQAPSRYHLEFTFDASTDCRISVHYAAVEQTVDGLMTCAAQVPPPPYGARPTAHAVGRAPYGGGGT